MVEENVIYQASILERSRYPTIGMQNVGDISATRAIYRHHYLPRDINGCLDRIVTVLTVFHIESGKYTEWGQASGRTWNKLSNSF